jgi:hypothetical protein
MTDGRVRQGERAPAGGGRRGGLRSLLGAGLALLAALPGAAQNPRAPPGQCEVRGFDIARRASAAGHGANRRHSGRVARDGAMARLNASDASLQVSGGYFVPVIPMAFRDVASLFPASDYQQVLFSATPVGRRSLKTFYGARNRVGTSPRWVRLRLGRVDKRRRLLRGRLQRHRGQRPLSLASTEPDGRSPPVPSTPSR